MQITPTVHRIGNFVNQYLLIDGKDLTLIDTGMRANAKTILKTLQQLGFDYSDLKRILITHSDADHYGAAFDIKNATGCEIWSSQIEAEAIKSGVFSRQIEAKGVAKLIMAVLEPVIMVSPAVPVDKIVSDGEILPILGGLHVIASPGHTPGHISFYLPAERILIAGDAFTGEKGKPVATTNATTGDPIMAIASAKKLLDLNPLVIGGGHAYFDYRN